VAGEILRTGEQHGAVTPASPPRGWARRSRSCAALCPRRHQRNEAFNAKKRNIGLRSRCTVAAPMPDAAPVMAIVRWSLVVIVNSALARVTPLADRRGRRAHRGADRRGGAAGPSPPTPGPVTGPGAARSRPEGGRGRHGDTSAAAQQPLRIGGREPDRTPSPRLSLRLAENDEGESPDARSHLLAGWRPSRRRGGPPPPPDPRAIAPTAGAAVPVCSRTLRDGFRASSHRPPVALPGPSAARYTPPTVMTRRPTVMTRRLGGHQAVWRGRKGVFTAYVSRRPAPDALYVDQSRDQHLVVEGRPFKRVERPDVK
jgi:hypothetical protein